MASAKTSRGSGFDLPTLAITAAASAGAAYVCSIVWAPGTLASAAFTPVLVALLKEALWRPAEVVTRAVPVRGVVRSATRADEPPGPVEPVADRVAQHGEIPGRSPSPRRRGWRLAIVTGLLGFLVAAVIITVPEFVAGQAATGGGRDTTLFGGRDKEASKPETKTTTTTAPARTVTVLPAETVTVPAPPTTTTAPPTETTTVPPETQTPSPPEAETPAPPEAPESVPPPG